MMNQRVNPGCVVKVGDGRGFIIGVRRHIARGHFVERRLVLTAAHCLPKLPPAFAWPTDERMYPNLLGRLRGKRNVWTECLFVDPVADIAVLGSPDNQALADAADAYETFVGSATALKGRSPVSHHLAHLCR